MSDLMADVMRPDERLSNVEWPALRKIRVPSIGSNDGLIMCGGFEDRSVFTLRRICESGASGFRLVLVTYLPNYGDNRVAEVRDIGGEAKLAIHEIVYDRREPAGIGEQLRDAMQSCDRVFLDISGMSRLLIVQAIVALVDGNKAPVSIIYGEAETYRPSRMQFEKDRQRSSPGLMEIGYLSSGIFEIAAAAELSSVSMVGQAIRLVAFPSFDPSQLANLIQELQPAFVEIISGVRSSPENKWRREAILELNGPSLRELKVSMSHSASTLDYRETLKVLVEVYRQHSMFDRLVVSPTGSKMQTVAVGLFRRVLHDVQIVYPTPKMFAKPNDYTVGVRRLYQMDVPVDAIWYAVGEADGY